MGENKMTPIEIERKYIIKIPSTKDLESSENYKKSEIEQIYLTSPAGLTHRIRKRVTDGKAEYTETKKVRIDKISSYEDEREITSAEYEALSENRIHKTRSVIKTRHTFLYRNQIFEIDVYPSWRSTCILETELKSRDDKVTFPPFIKIVKEVTGERGYSNAKMAEGFPEETKL